MNGELSIATLEDVPSLFKLINCSYRGEESKKGWSTETDIIGGLRITIEILEREILDPNSWIYIYKSQVDDQIIGCAQMKKSNDKLYIGLVTVFPTMQNQGLGKKIMNGIEGFAKEKGFEKLGITVVSIRKELVEWYERRGFIKTGEVKEFNCPDGIGVPKVDNLELISMEKILFK